MLNRVIIGVIAFLVSMVLCWYGGANFLERSFFNAYMLGVSIGIGLFAAVCPLIED